MEGRANKQKYYQPIIVNIKNDKNKGHTEALGYFCVTLLHH